MLHHFTSFYKLVQVANLPLRCFQTPKEVGHKSWRKGSELPIFPDAHDYHDCTVLNENAPRALMSQNHTKCETQTLNPRSSLWNSMDFRECRSLDRPMRPPPKLRRLPMAPGWWWISEGIGRDSHVCLQPRLLRVFHVHFHIFSHTFDFDCHLVVRKLLKFDFRRISDIMGLVNDVNVGRPTWMRLWMRCWWGDWLKVGGCRWFPKCGSEDNTVDTSRMTSKSWNSRHACRIQVLLCSIVQQSHKDLYDMCGAWYTGTYTQSSGHEFGQNHVPRVHIIFLDNFLQDLQDIMKKNHEKPWGFATGCTLELCALEATNTCLVAGHRQSANVWAAQLTTKLLRHHRIGTHALSHRAAHFAPFCFDHDHCRVQTVVWPLNLEQT
jgi:hypothetical protein